MTSFIKDIFKSLIIFSIFVVALLFFYHLENSTRYSFVLIGLISLAFYFFYEHFKSILKKDYYCRFEKKILDHNNETLVEFYLNYRLPFPPYIGLEISDELNPISGDSNDFRSHDFQEFYTGKITQVCWRGSSFSCNVDSYKIEKKTNLNDIIIAMLEHAWSIDKCYIEERNTVLTIVEKEIMDLKNNYKDESLKYIQLKRLERLQKKLK